MERTPSVPVRRLPRWWRRVLVSLRRANVFLLLEIAASAVLALMLAVSWLTLTSSSAEGQILPSRLTSSLLIGTLVPAMALIILVGRRLAIRRAAQSVLGSSGRLHVRLVWLFSLIAAIPTLLVVVFASFLFQSGVEFWFSDNSRGMLENANKLARGYYEDKLRDVGNETVAMAGDIRDYLDQAAITSTEFAEGYSFQVLSRQLNESAILERAPDGSLRTAAIVDPEKSDRRQRVTPQDLKRLDAGESVVVSASAQRIEAVTPVDKRRGIYLYAARTSDALALEQWERAQTVLKAYDMLTTRARALQLRFNLALFGVSLALVGLAVWAALRFADRQVAPLAELVSAARTIGSGNFAMRVAQNSGTDEIGLLARAFNRMTQQLEGQTQALVSANAQLEVRRAFIEAVLESITAGIVSIGRDGAIQLINSSAQRLLLDTDAASPIGRALSDVSPVFAQLVASGQPNNVIQHPLGGDLRTLAVRVVEDNNGHVITFEDITRQLLDQRRAAWSDVARRIAHEIKNPLTPIQLATERLKRRYGRQIENDPELFEELTSTIIRQVGDLRKMVDEFSSFARLPKPVFRAEDASDLVRQSLFLQEVAHTAIDFSFACDAPSMPIQCDRHQFAQVMTNVLKNAVEAIEAKAKTEDVDYRGRIAVTLAGDHDTVTVSVTDNGIGLPAERERILEPYMTTREKGTGLGLAIVHKIVEEHGGEMAFTAEPGGGTRVTMRFARDPLATSAHHAEQD
ncbi:periplasmic sensor signal transduction histidine kinase [Novosphingobium aromaticivorans DSM 12444]|uniref:histidine kinase n=1 Tax=Novosphingobium aromaticivorans (strain ATCC 700278 / DSM 12444 / CCUG 56034 / CIP 105152 / NBRC 16084 / F199) TaxID=279238 RepID=Q2G704_NOVAD|nr:ATP-binding protein [Novosphingobium aromaticivorans]ABD26369.1 periplasmic sensor signal transduction histidine kinase [Novosphingobium aromaticivorans DSM 12444]SCY53324.1 two-component system, NtrC family, nitrogen regulation sensor histidine kinase NtrY [Novosphingobium aromaticivorans]